MDRYLTKQARRPWGWEIPVAMLSILTGCLAIDVSVDSFDPAEPVVSLLASLTVVALTLLPLWFVGRNILRRRLARRIAAKLDACSEHVLPLRGLDGVLGIDEAEKKIRRLLHQGLLKEIFFSEEYDEIILKSAPGPAKVEMKISTDESYEDILQEIRRLNDEIDDEPVSAKIDRLEKATAGIFEAMRGKPERAEEAQKWLRYYLPTTLKLLESYNLMEDQSYQGENIRASRARIEGMLEKLIYAVEQQHDRLFLPEAMDVEAEIRAMETMLRADGLTEEKVVLRAQQGAK